MSRPSELVSLLNVEASLGVSVEVLDLYIDQLEPLDTSGRGLQQTHVSGEGHGGSLGFLGEGDDTGDGGVSLEDSDSLWYQGEVRRKGMKGKGRYPEGEKPKISECFLLYMGSSRTASKTRNALDQISH